VDVEWMGNFHPTILIGNMFFHPASALHIA